MIPPKFKFLKTSDLNKALSTLDQESVTILAGGHSLIPTLKLRLDYPKKLLDIRSIKSLNFIEELNNELVIGSTTTYAQIASSKLVASKLKGLSECVKVIGDLQVRNFGTIGGSLVHADPAADLPVVMLATDASFKLVSQEDQRFVKAIDFFQGLYTTDIKQGELLLSIHIPLTKGTTRSAYEKFPHPASRYPLVGCAVYTTLEENTFKTLNIAFTGISSNYVLDTHLGDSLLGKTVTSENITQAVEESAQGIDMTQDNFASPKYRRHLTKIMAKRALLRACGLE